MKNLKIEATAYTPFVNLDFEIGSITFYGRSIMEVPENFYKDIIKWIKTYVNNNPEKYTIVNVGFDYMNTASSKIIYNILKDLSIMNKKYIKFIIKYEEDDEDMYTVYENFEYLLDVDFEYQVIMF